MLMRGTNPFGRQGFTLIELSIVLVVIGLIVGGVLVGQNLISAAAVRKQVTDLEAFSTATNTFYGKFGYLPGDIPPNVATSFGLSSYGEVQNWPGDGNIQDSGHQTVVYYLDGEVQFFFIHLSQANMVKGSFAYNPTLENGNGFGYIGYGNQFPPLATNPIYGMAPVTYAGNVWFYLGLAPNPSSSCGDNNVGPSGCAWIAPTSALPGVLTPAQAYGVDVKIDDGKPSTGTVLAVVPNPTYSSLDGTLDLTPSQCAADATGKAYNINSGLSWCRLFVRLR